MSGPLGSSQWMYNAGGDFYPTVIDQSLRFDSSAHLYRTATSGNSRTFTWSSWVKVSTIASNSNLLEAATTSGNPYTSIWIDGNAQLSCYIGSNGGTVLTASPKLRDPSAWYHIVFAFDTTQADNSNRIKFYINGLEPTYTTRLTITQNLQVAINTAESRHDMGAGIGGNYDLNGYMADTYFVDGTALDATSFGEFKSGVWIPKAYTGSYGTNGFHLEYSDNTNDSSGTGNNWAATNIVAGDYMLDSPTNNYATLNPLDNAGASLANGNLQVTSSGASWKTVRSTFAMPSGSWYTEFTSTVGTGNGNSFVGIAPMGVTLPLPVGENSATSWGYSSNGNVYNNGSIINATGSAWSAGATVAIAFDGSTLKFYNANTLVATISSIPENTYAVGISFYDNNAGTLNFGQSGFTYTPPDGFLALCTANLPEPSISPANGDSPQDYFNTVLYTGNGGTQTVSGVGFEPDFTWVKQRSGATSHWLNDAVRGAGLSLASNTTEEEKSYAAYFTAFNNDGFALAGGTGGFNNNASTYASWNWKASNATAVSNTAGTITSQVSANPTAGFSIVSYTGTGVNATVGHGLGVAPKMVIVKSRSVADAWAVYHGSLGATKYLLLNSTASADTASTLWNNTAPTSSVFSISTSGAVNTSSATLIAYCFADVEGYSKFGSYTGNGLADGTFVYTGFRPAWLLIKNTTTAGYYWCLLDNKRSPYNTEWQRLYPNDSLAEDTGQGNWDVDAVSNGFKLRGLNQNQNQSGSNYIYMAFAENPFKYANAR